MEDRNEREDSFRRYLLGMLDADAQQQLEERLLRDQDDFDELQIAEDELIDQYISDALSVAERERFEQVFLAARERQQKVKFAKALHRYVGREKPASTVSGAVKAGGEQPASFWKRLRAFAAQRPLAGLTAVAMVVVIGITVGLLVKNIRLPASPPRNARPAVVSLSPNVTRGEGKSNTVTIDASTSVIEAQLELLSDKYPSYETVILTRDGREIDKLTGLTSETSQARRIVVCRVPVEKIAVGDYEILLRGVTASGVVEDIKGYVLRIEKSSS